MHDNIVIEALEFNGFCQWSTEKVLQIPKLITAPSNVILEDLKLARKKPTRKGEIQGKRQQLHDQYRCNRCYQWLSAGHFYSGYWTICKFCRISHLQTTKNTLRGYMRWLRGNAKVNRFKRCSSNEDTRHECTISLDDLFDSLEEQNFRCYYSGIPMQLKTNADWRCSLERLDNINGYTKKNCVLICWEFNSVDQTPRAKSPVYGSAQWSRGKFLSFYRTRFGTEPPSMLI